MQKKVFIKNKNGLKLTSVIECPNYERKYPFAILLHGFKGYKDETTYTELARELLLNGIGSIRFDASGFADSEGTIKDDYRFGNYVVDTEFIYAWLLKQAFVNKDRIGVCGQSMGGMQAIVFVSKHPEIKALCVVSSPEKMATKDLLNRELNGWKKRGYLEMESSRYDHLIRFPYEFIEEAMKWDMRDFVSKINCPSLYLWGNKDTTVKPEQTRLLFELANEPKNFLEIKGMNHFYKKDKEMLVFINQKIVDFFQKYFMSPTLFTCGVVEKL